MDQEKFENYIKQEFLAEAEELVETLESLMLDLEKTDNRSPIIDSIFRVAHTIKGSGYAAGFDEVAKVAHAFENLLNDVRNGKREITEQIITISLQVTDVIAAFTASAKKGEDYPMDDLPVVRELNTLLTQVVDSGTQGDKADAATVEARPDEFAVETRPLPKVEGIKQVLVVDDDADIREILVEILQDVFETIKIAEDGEIALKLIENNQFDLVVTDIYMPNMDGIEFVRQLREIHPSLPVIFCSGCATKQDMMAVVDLGGIDFWDKPLDMDRVEVTLRNAALFKYTRETISRLCVLNFRAYVDLLRVSSDLGLDSPQLQDKKDKIESSLREIQKLTRDLISQTTRPGKKKAG